MSEPISSELFHSQVHAFDPLQYVQCAYGGPYPDSYGEEILGWIMDTIHMVFAEGRKHFGLLHTERPFMLYRFYTV